MSGRQVTPTKPFFLNKLTDKDTGSFVWRLPALPMVWVKATGWGDQTPMRFVFELNASEPEKSKITIEKMGE
jgi:hypothetical protein